MRRKYYHVHSLLITDKSYQLVQTKASNYGIQEERINSQVMIQTIRIGWVVLDILQSWRTMKPISVQWVGMEESKYGIPISKSDLVINIMMKVWTVCLSLQMGSTWPVVGLVRQSEYMMSHLWVISPESLNLIVKYTNWSSILRSNGLQLLLMMESRYGI